MRKIIALTLALAIVLAMGAAWGWSNVTTPEADTYRISLHKYRRISSDAGRAYTIDPTATATTGDIVYWGLSVTKDGKAVSGYDVTYQGIQYIGTIDNLHYGRVTEPHPRLTVKIEEKTNVNDLYWQGKRIIVATPTVVIGGLTFDRAANGTVTNVHYNGTALELMTELDKLGMTLNEVYNGQIVMTNDALVSNFGRIASASASLDWGANITADITDIALPKTGDMSLLAPMIVLAGAACVLIRRYL